MRGFVRFLLLFLLYAIPAAAQQNSTVWFYRLATDSGGIIPTLFWVQPGSSTRLATLNGGEFFGIAVPAGIQSFSYTAAPARTEMTVLALNPGQQVFLEVESRRITPVATERGTAALQQLRPVNPVNVFSPTVIQSPPPLAAPTTAPAVSPAPRPVQPAALPAPATQAEVPRQIFSDTHNEFRRFEIFWAPYSFSRQGDLNLHGGDLSLTVHVSETVGVVADLSVHQSLETFLGANAEIITYRFGPKFSTRLGDRVTAFGQILAGGVRFNGEFASTIGSTTVELGNGFSFLAGGGMDLGIRNWFAIRVIEGGYSALHFSDIGGTEGWSNGLRLSGGIVFRFGN